jgi:hypothetical protein
VAKHHVRKFATTNVAKTQSGEFGIITTNVAKHEARKFATTKTTTTNVAKTQSGEFGTTKTTTNVAKHEVVNL